MAEMEHLRNEQYWWELNKALQELVLGEAEKRQKLERAWEQEQRQEQSGILAEVKALGLTLAQELVEAWVELLIELGLGFAIDHFSNYAKK